MCYSILLYIELNIRLWPYKERYALYFYSGIMVTVVRLLLKCVWSFTLRYLFCRTGGYRGGGDVEYFLGGIKKCMNAANTLVYSLMLYTRWRRWGNYVQNLGTIEPTCGCLLVALMSSVWFIFKYELLQNFTLNLNRYRSNTLNHICF